MLAMAIRQRPDSLLVHAEALRTEKKFSGLDNFYNLLWAYLQAVKGNLPTGFALGIRNVLPLLTGADTSPQMRDLSMQFFET